MKAVLIALVAGVVFAAIVATVALLWLGDALLAAGCCT